MKLYELLKEGCECLEAAGICDAQIDAKQLLMAAFDMDMTHFLLERMQPIPEDETGKQRAAQYRDWIGARSRRTPLQQILGETEFMGLPFYVNEHVLIPRQDTETLVELVLEDCRKLQNELPQEELTAAESKKKEVVCERRNGLRLLDVCTGSGCIALSLAVKGSWAQIHASDLSEQALKVAEKNASRLLADDVQKRQNFMLYQGDLFDALPHDGGKYDIITSNPPYIPTDVIAGLEPEVKDHEPLMALDGSSDGLVFYRRIARDAQQYLNEGGKIYLEIGYDQGAAVRELMKQAGYMDVQVIRDLAGNDRVVCAQKI